MNLGKKRKNSLMPEIAKGSDVDPKDTIEYPSVRIEKKLGEYSFGDEFTATCKFRVKHVSEGKEYSGQEPAHRIELELLSMNVEGAKKEKKKSADKGLPS